MLKFSFLTCNYIFLILSFNTLFADGKFYSDGHGGKVYFPAGDLSFADKVVAFDSPATTKNMTTYLDQSIGINDRKSLSLGCGGSVILAFEDNALIDIEGDDLHIYEIGPHVEPTSLSISQDGSNWIDIGRVTGGKSAVDIAPFVSSDLAFRFIKLTDLKSSCRGRHAGADIDAVAAIGSGIRLSFSSAVLFDVAQYELKSSAYHTLEALIKEDEYKSMRVVVEGHTDSIDTVQYNQTLSLNRAKSVKKYLVDNAGFKAENITIKGYGESQPIASNDTEEGREKNRRVELLLVLLTPSTN